MATGSKRNSVIDGVSRPSTAQRRQSVSTRSWIRQHLCPRESLDDFVNPVFWRDVVIEFILCMFLECCVIWTLTSLHAEMYLPSTTHFGIFAGFFIYALIEGYGPVSGAPMNPAGCWGFFLAGRMSAARMVLYTGVETAGSAAGAMIGASLTPTWDVEANITIPVIMPGKGLTAPQGMAIEAILTFNLLFVALSVTNPRGKMAIMPSFPIAFCIGTGILAAGTHTGGLQNPIVAFGPAVVNNNFKNHWLYWVGPYIGATVGSVIYQFSEFVKDHFEHHLPHEDENVGLHNPSHVQNKNESSM